MSEKVELPELNVTDAELERAREMWPGVWPSKQRALAERLCRERQLADAIRERDGLSLLNGTLTSWLNATRANYEEQYVRAEQAERELAEARAEAKAARESARQALADSCCVIIGLMRKRTPNEKAVEAAEQVETNRALIRAFAQPADAQKEV